jgi:L-asparaginase
MTVLVIATGGTISSHFDGREWTNLLGRQLVDEAGPHAVPVEVVDVATGPSSNLTVADMVQIADRVRRALDGGADGVVVLHGTDTMELTAFVVQLRLGVQPDRAPVVFTGSMRVHSHVAPDGPANVRDAIVIAASTEAIGREVLVCLEGQVHAAAEVTKHNANSVDAFTSHPFEPIGQVSDGAVTFRRPARATPATSGLDVEVPLFTCCPGVSGEEFARLADGRRGIVVEAFGDINVPHQLWMPIHTAWNAGTLVVLASRPFTQNTGDDDLRSLGAVGAGGLTPQKARLAMMAALTTCATREDAIGLLHRYALTYDAHDRSTAP